VKTLHELGYLFVNKLVNRELPLCPPESRVSDSERPRRRIVVHFFIKLATDKTVACTGRSTAAMSRATRGGHAVSALELEGAADKGSTTSTSHCLSSQVLHRVGWCRRVGSLAVLPGLS